MRGGWIHADLPHIPPTVTLYATRATTPACHCFWLRVVNLRSPFQPVGSPYPLPHHRCPDLRKRQLRTGLDGTLWTAAFFLQYLARTFTATGRYRCFYVLFNTHRFHHMDEQWLGFTGHGQLFLFCRYIFSVLLFLFVCSLMFSGLPLSLSNIRRLPCPVCSGALCIVFSMPLCKCLSSPYGVAADGRSSGYAYQAVPAPFPILFLPCHHTGRSFNRLSAGCWWQRRLRNHHPAGRPPDTDCWLPLRFVYCRTPAWYPYPSPHTQDDIYGPPHLPPPLSRFFLDGSDTPATGRPGRRTAACELLQLPFW